MPVTRTNAIPDSFIIPSGFCECGCGKKTKICEFTNSKKGRYKGYPHRFINGHNAAVRLGENHPGYKGGVYYKQGYKMVYDPSNPDAYDSGYIPEHRLVVSKHLGRRLRADEHIHHINGIITDNSISNLQIVSRAEHFTIHRTKWSESKILVAFQRFYDEFGVSPNQTNRTNVSYLPAAGTVKRWFGHWNNVLRELGLPLAEEHNIKK